MIVFHFEKPDDATVAITLHATNSNPAPINDFVFQAAVPKVSATFLACVNVVLLFCWFLNPVLMGVLSKVLPLMASCLIANGGLRRVFFFITHNWLVISISNPQKLHKR